MAGNTIDVFEDLYDNIDDLLNFSCENIDQDMKFLSEDIVGSESSGLNQVKDVWQAPQDNQSHYSCDSFISGGDINPQLPTELLVPYEDIAHLEWLSNFVEESFSPVNTTLVDQDLIFNNYNNNNNNHKENNDPQRFQTRSPVSVLDSSNSCSEIKTMPIHPEIVVPGRARSKRPRPTSFKHPSMIPLMPPTSSVFDPMPPFPSSELCSSFEHSAEYRKALNMAKACGKDPKKKKAKVSPMLASFEESSSEPSTSVRKCLHCGITKTPQWRLGPLGPKTLCNACGVRYKSGRLFPEYRPAASPTFVPSLHSNSHKKVLEMRTKGDHNKEDLWLNDNSPLITYEGREKLLY